jgi:glycosyltransferase involved in cell wall biosynthesis
VVKFSVVINTYNRGSSLDDALNGLSELDYPTFEVVVVNGPSTDNTAQVLADWQGRIKIGHCNVANLSVSRNIGIQMAEGDVVAFLDDDAIPHPQWLSRIAGHYVDDDVGAVGGFTIDNTGVAFQARKTLCDRFGNAYFPHDYVDERGFMFPGSPMYPSLLGTNSSFRLRALRAIGGFDKVFAYFLDETDVCLRLTDRGYKVLYEPDAIIYHQFAPSHIRGTNRLPKTLYPSAVSKAYFIQRHGSVVSEARAADELAKYETDILDANAWLYHNGKITLAHKVSLDEDLRFGIRDGLRLAWQKQLSDPETLPSGDLDRAATPASFLPMSRKSGLRIAFVSRSFPPHSEAGIARWTAMMARGLADRGHVVHVITLAEEQPYTRFENGFWVHAVPEDRSEEALVDANATGIPSGMAGWCAAARATVKMLKSFNIDVVSFPIWDIEGALLLNETVPVVMSLHTSYRLAQPFKEEWTVRPLLGHFHVAKTIAVEDRLLRSLPHLLGNSEAIVRDVEEAYGVSIANKTTVAPHGTFDYQGVGSEHLGVKLAAVRSQSPMRVLYVGRFERRKGFDLACDAFSRVLRTSVDIHFEIVGGTLNEARDQLSPELFQILTNEPRVRFHGVVSRHELDRHYLDSDVVVMPSRYESFGLVAIEAMAAASPVIALAAGGLAEVIGDGADGFLISPDIPDGQPIAERIMELADDPRLLADMQAAARKSFETRYTVAHMAESAERIYYAATRSAACELTAP